MRLWQLTITIACLGASLVAGQGFNLCFNERETAAGGNLFNFTGVDRFGLHLFREVARNHPQGQNLVMSSFSIWSALSLALMGAKGDTKRQLESALGLPSSKLQAFRNKFALNFVINTLGNGKDGRPHVRNFDKGYFDQAVNLRACVAQVLHDLETVDFSKPGEAASIINSDVSHATGGVIRDMLSADSLQDIRMVLINAVYFKGFWLKKFDVRQTVTMPFYNEQGAPISQAQMMRQSIELNIVQSTALGAQMVELPYQDSNMSMLLLLPDPTNPDVSAVLANLNPYTLDEALQGAQPTTLQLTMPKFDMETRIRDTLKTVLNTMGIEDLFDTRKANLTDFTSSPLAISAIMHQAAIKVDEEGTVAAAATALVGTRSGFTPNFLLNRPFAFLVYEKTLKITLFSGIVNDPTK